MLLRSKYPVSNKQSFHGPNMGINQIIIRWLNRFLQVTSNKQCGEKSVAITNKIELSIELT